MHAISSYSAFSRSRASTTRIKQRATLLWFAPDHLFANPERYTELSMRKRIITPTPETIRSRAEGWLDVERAAIVEITSEDEGYPVESVFLSLPP